MDPTEGLPPLNVNAAGIDVGSAEHYVAVPTDRDAEPIQSFGSFTADLHRMARWLKDCRTVVMQATGVYWTALYDVLESHSALGRQRWAPEKPRLGRKSKQELCKTFRCLH